MVSFDGGVGEGSCSRVGIRRQWMLLLSWN